MTGVTVFGIGIQKAIRIAIAANHPNIWGSIPAERLNFFLEARRGMVDAADLIFGMGSNEADAVKRAWDAVGVVEPPPP